MRPVSTTSSSDRFEYAPLHHRAYLHPPYQHQPFDSEDTFFLVPGHYITMRSWLICLCMLTVVVACNAQQRQQNLHNRYDNFNADSIIQNERILLAYYKCVMDKGPCTKDGKNFKRVLPETLTTACARCSSKQKVVVRQLLLGIRSKSEPRFNELLEKYDPERLNRDALYNFLVIGN